MKIIIKTIPHSSQPYATVGDWKIHDNGDWEINVSDMSNDDYAFLVALHELIEMKLCQHRKIAEADVSAFDIAFENKRVGGNTDEPGDDSESPYRKEHLLATGIEKIMASLLDVDWKKYDETVNEL